MARQATEEEIALTLKIIRELAVAAMVFLVPYVIIGVLWAGNHDGKLTYMSGFHKMANWAGEVVAWPVLIFTDLELE